MEFYLKLCVLLKDKSDRKKELKERMLTNRLQGLTGPLAETLKSKDLLRKSGDSTKAGDDEEPEDEDGWPMEWDESWEERWARLDDVTGNNKPLKYNDALILTSYFYPVRQLKNKLCSCPTYLPVASTFSRPADHVFYSNMLYDDLDPQEKPSGSAAKPAMPSWASGMKMFQSHLHLKKAGTTQSPGSILQTTCMGAAIAPPPSLQESGSSGGKSVAAKIMAKYGFREGQGLGKLQQGISTALVVEKTSKRGGRIIAEQEAKELAMLPPLFPPPVPAVGTPPANTKNEPQSITDLMKNPSKVVLLRNMVGPGEVDDDLEPEVKEECQTKYGDVVQVVLYEMPGVPDDEAVRIFVEFKRVESAIKAVVDINGRFFGGRQVKAGFYDLEKLKKLDLAS
nr:EOG090X0BIL [Lepidurus arcticus]